MAEFSVGALQSDAADTATEYSQQNRALSEYTVGSLSKSFFAR